MSHEKIDIRDLRDGKFLWIDKAALRLISREAGHQGVTVYSWLCYYANFKGQDCFPSVTTLARNCQVSRRTVMRAVKRLEKIGVIVIERVKGRANIYKLLDVENSKPTGDTAVTSDMDVMGVVTRVSPPLVTPVSPEQEISEQKIINKTPDAFFDLWKTQDLPYLSPEERSVQSLAQLCEALLEEVNVYRLLFEYQSEHGFPPHPDVVLAVGGQFTHERGRIDNPWGWFKWAVEFQMRVFLSKAALGAG